MIVKKRNEGEIMRENNNIEFKREYTSDIKKEVIACAVTAEAERAKVAGVARP